MFTNSVAEGEIPQSITTSLPGAFPRFPQLEMALATLVYGPQSTKSISAGADKVISIFPAISTSM
jgi:hypothetical protein